jgi:hypothetical protein
MLDKPDDGVRGGGSAPGSATPSTRPPAKNKRIVLFASLASAVIVLLIILHLLGG